MSDSYKPMVCDPLGSSVHGTLQARTLEWASISFSRGSSQPRNWTQVSCTAGRFFTHWATGVGLMLKLKLQYFGHLMQRTDSLEKTLMLGKIEGGRRRGQQRMRWLALATPTQWRWIWVNFGSWWWTGRSGVLQSNTGLQRVGHNWTTDINPFWDIWSVNFFSIQSVLVLPFD